MSYCSPHIKDNKITCYSLDGLTKIANTYNKYSNKNNKILITVNKKQLWKRIQEKLKDKCNDEWCWKNHDLVREIRHDPNLDVFKPIMPKDWYKNINTWLDTNNINNVMKQYEKKHKDFDFYGAVPSDCPMSITCNLNNLNLQKLRKKGIKKIGIIYNLDKHNEPGSHWVALFIDQTINKEPIIEYYDSAGVKPIPRIYNYIELLKNKYNLNNQNAIILYNDIRHQYGNSECGMYSMNYILERLKGKTMKQICTKKIPDKKMEKLRLKLFLVTKPFSK